MARRLTAGIIIAYLIAVVQTTIGGRLALAGAAPDLLLVWVVCIGLLAGPRVGMVAGFACGLIEGSLLQASVGALAISKGVAGLGAGVISGAVSRDHWLAPPLAAAVLTVAAEAVFLLLSPVSGWTHAARLIVVRVVYHAALSVVAFAAISRGWRVTGEPNQGVA
ncbi:MAG: LytS/YhcK type 5TM receptor domain-containing protein [Armatimonadota bacterium]